MRCVVITILLPAIKSTIEATWRGVDISNHCMVLMNVHKIEYGTIASISTANSRRKAESLGQQLRCNTNQYAIATPTWIPYPCAGHRKPIMYIVVQTAHACQLCCGVEIAVRMLMQVSPWGYAYPCPVSLHIACFAVICVSCFDKIQLLCNILAQE